MCSDQMRRPDYYLSSARVIETEADYQRVIKQVELDFDNDFPRASPNGTQFALQVDAVMEYEYRICPMGDDTDPEPYTE